MDNAPFLKSLKETMQPVIINWILTLHNVWIFFCLTGLLFHIYFRSDQVPSKERKRIFADNWNRW